MVQSKNYFVKLPMTTKALNSEKKVVTLDSLNPEELRAYGLLQRHRNVYDTSKAYITIDLLLHLIEESHSSTKRKKLVDVITNLKEKGYINISNKKNNSLAKGLLVIEFVDCNPFEQIDVEDFDKLCLNSNRLTIFAHVKWRGNIKRGISFAEWENILNCSKSSAQKYINESVEFGDIEKHSGARKMIEDGNLVQEVNRYSISKSYNFNDNLEDDKTLNKVNETIHENNNVEEKNIKNNRESEQVSEIKTITIEIDELEKYKTKNGSLLGSKFFEENIGLMKFWIETIDKLDENGLKGLLGFSGIKIKKSDYSAYKNSSNENFKEVIEMFLESKAKVAPTFEFILKKLEDNDEYDEVRNNVQKNSDAPFGDDGIAEELNRCFKEINTMIKSGETYKSEFLTLVNKYENGCRLLGVPNDPDFREFIVNEK